MTEAKARTNPVGPLYHGKELAHLNAFRSRSLDLKGWYQLCFKGLSVGDHDAPDIAQDSHVNALRAVGCMKADETLEYRKKVPYYASGFYEGVMIDDRVGVQLVPKKGAAQALRGDRRRDTEASEASDEQYAAVELEVNARKNVRRALVFEA